MRRLILIVATLSLAFAPAPLPKKDRQRPDLTDVAGTWEFVSCELSGRPNPGMDTLYKVEMTAAQFVYVTKTGRGRIEYDLRLDATASPPSFTRSLGQHVLWVGSYRLRGKDEIEMIFSSGTQLNQRPTDFDGKPASRYVLRRTQR